MDNSTLLILKCLKKIGRIPVSDTQYCAGKSLQPGIRKTKEGKAFTNMAQAMVDCWKLTTIGMWVDKLENDGALKLICDNFTWE